MSSDAHEVVIRYPRAQARSIGGMALGIIGLPLLIVVLAATLGREAPTWTSFAALATAVACGVAWATHRARQGRLEVDADGLSIAHGKSERRRISKTDIEAGLLVGDAERLDLTLTSGEVLQIRFENADATRETFAALALGDPRRRSRYRLYSQGSYVGFFGVGMLVGAVPGAFLGLVLATLVGGVGAGSTGWGSALTIVTALVTSWLGGRLVSMIHPELTIGEDGIAWRVGGARTRFTTYEQLTGISLVGVGGRASASRTWRLQIEVAGKKPQPIAYYQPSRLAEARAVLVRLESAIASRAPLASAPGLAELEAGERPVGEWLAALRQRGSGADDYQSALSREQLLELVDDPAAATEHRIAAAVVLSSETDEATRDRIRIASQSSANPKLSAALDAIGSADLEADAIEEALEQSRSLRA